MEVKISAGEVNKLRQMTGAGMMDCKKALTETNGDFDAAVDLLRKKGQKVSAARAENKTSEGVVLIDVADDQKSAIAIAFACETEPVSKVDLFRDLGAEILNAAVKNQPASTEDLLALTIADGRSINENIIDLTGKIGEKLVISRYENVKGEVVVPYLHSNNKIGVLVVLKGANGQDVSEVGKDVAMQIAAMNPIALDKDGVDASVIEREIEIGKEQARAEGKPENMLEKIAQGKLNKFYKENTLLNQQFVKDNSLTISQVLDNTVKGLTVVDFKRVTIE